MTRAVDGEVVKNGRLSSGWKYGTMITIDGGAIAPPSQTSYDGETYMIGNKMHNSPQSESRATVDNPQKGGIAIEIDALTKEVRKLENGIETLYGMIHPALTPSTPSQDDVDAVVTQQQRSDIATVVSNLQYRVTEQVGVIVSIIKRLDI